MERRRLLITIFPLAASCASAFARDGSVRAVVDSQGSVVERNDYYTYGKRHTTGRTYADLKNSPLLFSGKEDQGQALDIASGATTPSAFRILDFGARHYDPIVPRWTTPDPLAEKYFPINTYAYCAGDPVNLADPEGKNWYSYTDSTGTKQYKYVEGQLGDEEIEKGGYTDLGFTFYDEETSTYYSLFGNTVTMIGPSGKPLLQSARYYYLDNFIIEYYCYNKRDFSFCFYFGIPPGDYPFSYEGVSFKSTRGRKRGTFFIAVNNKENSYLKIKESPKYVGIYFGGVTPADQWYGHPLILQNKKGSDLLFLNFDDDNVASFWNAVHNLFNNGKK